MAERMDLKDYLVSAKEISVGAGKKIMEVYKRDFKVTDKQDGSPLTEADQAAHEYIVEQLRKMTPDIPVLSEESSSTEYEDRSSWRRFWLVDPLDGTKEFVKRNGEFTVNIALIREGQPVLGVVHAPDKDVTYYAAQGVGAFKDDATGQGKPISVGKYRGGPATVVASRSHTGEAITSFLKELTAVEGEPETTCMGSSLKLCLVAEGVADVYPRLGLTSEWDTAAAHCVVEVAGGKVTDLEANRLAYNKPDILNPFFIVADAGDYDWIAYTKHGN